MIETDQLSTESIGLLDQILDLNTNDAFAIWICLAEALAERSKSNFILLMASWCHQSLSEYEEERWNSLRECINIVVRTMPIEMRTSFRS